MKKIAILSTHLFVLGVMVLVPLSINAQTSGGGTVNPGGTSGGGTVNPSAGPISHKIEFKNPLSIGEKTISGFVEAVLNNIVIPIGAVVSVFFIIYAGFMFVTAQGSEDKLKSAKTALLNAVIGSLIVLGSWTIAQVIKGTITQIGGPTF